MASGSTPPAVAAAARWRARAGAWVRAWSRALATATGAGAAAGAGQLGVAYGLGILQPTRSFPDDGSWSAQLTWMAWCAAVAVLAGAVGGAWSARRSGHPHQAGSRIAVAVAAAAGAALVVPLSAIPARSAELGSAATVPALDAALAAGLGLVVGVLAAIAVLSARLVASTVTLLVGALWLVGLVSVAPSLGPTARLPQVRLGVLDLPALRESGSTVALVSAPVAVLLACGVVAAVARSRGVSPLTIAMAGAAAPGLLALVYLIGSPGTGDRTVQAPPYAGSLIAVAAGLLVATVVAVVRLPARGGGDGTGGVPVGSGGPAGPPDPTGTPPSDQAAADPPAQEVRAPDHGVAVSGPEPARSSGPASPVIPPQPGPATPPRSRGGRRDRARKPSSPAAPPGVTAPPTGGARPPKVDPDPGSPPAEPSPAAGPSSPSASPAPDGPTAVRPPEPAARPKRRRRRDRPDPDDHVDWIASLSGPAVPEDPELGKRRLRQDP